jgi:hypothetical protein
LETPAGSTFNGVVAITGEGIEMNERIKELADQAGGDLNKFAALIIQDCVACCEIVAQAAIYARDGASDAYLEGREDAARLCKVAIQKHFGEGK